MIKLLKSRMKKINEMTFPSFFVYDFRSNEKQLMRINDSHNFLFSLAFDIYYSPEKMSLQDMIVSAAKYAFWSKAEYEHWFQNERIDEDGFYEQFDAWAKNNLDAFLVNHPLTKMHEKEIRRIKKKQEKKEATKT